MPTVVIEEKDERDALLNFVEAQSAAVRRAVGGLSREQLTAQPTVSELTLGGLVKHLAEMESNWVRVILAGREPLVTRDTSTWSDSFRLVEGEEIGDVLTFWDEVAAETAEIVGGLPDLEVTVPLPDRPWFPKGAERSARWILLHLIEEIGRHAGHADILREATDGATAFQLLSPEQLRPND
ncbi:DinB family protein [Streptacidiphilus fuscans]|uniref:DinB family protein n=1 Tax=Streptacidiphilus fuscans TaxID=2789292 RepID=A0A931B885_9ACTN|nr:DinB family protein [Streptacidiphilus fuscans]MBF9072219.1 DinB family protein [Streptacidiphilus fuscans]MBF9073030.1 DinB family protein [Streptacidiphilus fuscans]